MSRWPPVLTDSLEPRPEELDGLRPPCAPTWCAEATAPSEAELARLVAHAAGPRATPSLARARLAWALMAASILLAVLHLVPTPGDPVPPTGATAQLDGTLLRFGPSVTVSGQGAIEVIRSDEQGTVLALLTGQALFEVDPTGQRRQLTVRAGEVRVEVTGTRFMVRKDQARVSVEVSRGSVRIHRPSGSLTLSAGEHWGSTEQHGDPTVVPTAPPEAHTVVLGPTAAAEPAPPLGPSPLGDASPAEPTEPGPTASSHTAAQAWSTLLALRAAGHGEVVTEIAEAGPFYYAEDYHQQYLHKNPDGYCGLGGTGVTCPV